MCLCGLVTEAVPYTWPERGPRQVVQSELRAGVAALLGSKTQGSPPMAPYR